MWRVRVFPERESGRPSDPLSTRRKDDSGDVGGHGGSQCLRHATSARGSTGSSSALPGAPGGARGGPGLAHGAAPVALVPETQAPAAPAPAPLPRVASAWRALERGRDLEAVAHAEGGVGTCVRRGRRRGAPSNRGVRGCRRGRCPRPRARRPVAGLRPATGEGERALRRHLPRRLRIHADARRSPGRGSASWAGPLGDAGSRAAAASGGVIASAPGRSESRQAPPLRARAAAPRAVRHRLPLRRSGEPWLGGPGRPSRPRRRRIARSAARRARPSIPVRAAAGVARRSRRRDRGRLRDARGGDDPLRLDPLMGCVAPRRRHSSVEARSRSRGLPSCSRVSPSSGRRRRRASSRSTTASPHPPRPSRSSSSRRRSARRRGGAGSGWSPRSGRPRCRRWCGSSPTARTRTGARSPSRRRPRSCCSRVQWSGRRLPSTTASIRPPRRWRSSEPASHSELPGRSSRTARTRESLWPPWRPSTEPWRSPPAGGGGISAGWSAPRRCFSLPSRTADVLSGRSLSIVFAVQAVVLAALAWRLESPRFELIALAYLALGIGRCGSRRARGRARAGRRPALGGGRAVLARGSCSGGRAPSARAAWRHPSSGIGAALEPLWDGLVRLRAWVRAALAAGAIALAAAGSAGVLSGRLLTIVWAAGAAAGGVLAWRRESPGLALSAMAYLALGTHTSARWSSRGSTRPRDVPEAASLAAVLARRSRPGRGAPAAGSAPDATSPGMAKAFEALWGGLMHNRAWIRAGLAALAIALAAAGSAGALSGRWLTIAWAVATAAGGVAAFAARERRLVAVALPWLRLRLLHRCRSRLRHRRCARPRARPLAPVPTSLRLAPRAWCSRSPVCSTSGASDSCGRSRASRLAVLDGGWPNPARHAPPPRVGIRGCGLWASR